MKIYDISVNISNTLPTWPGDPAVKIERDKELDKGDGANVSRISMGVHTGTHIDAPYHFLASGKTVEKIPLENLTGPCRVIEVNAGKSITASDLQQVDMGNSNRILLKTKNSELWREGTKEFFRDFIAPDVSAAEYLIEKKIILVGIDYLSIEGFYAEPGNPVHNKLLASNIILLEGLNLSGVAPGDYELICLPLNISGTDGAPVRAVLRDLA